MKKILAFVAVAAFVWNTASAQEDDTKKKFRAGLKFSVQPSWFQSGDPNTTKLKTGFGYGFGLVTDFRLSDVIYFSTGIGGDFEGGTIKYRDDGYSPTGNNTDKFYCSYILDNSNAFVELKDNTDAGNYAQDGSSMYILSSRKIKTTHITIPISLKMLTKELSGFRYFGQFGGDIGIRAAAKAEDSYSYKYEYKASGGIVQSGAGTNPVFDIRKDCSLIPIRFGMNIGLGAEYRMAGSTSLFLSVNYFRSFTNLMAKESDYIYTDSTLDLTTNNVSYVRLPQKLFMSAIKINVGVMF